MLTSSNLSSNEVYASATPRQILIAEDDLCLQTVMLAVLRKIDPNINCVWVTSAKAAIAELAECRFEFVIADHHLTDERTGMDIWRMSREIDPQVPFILMSNIGVQEFLTMTDSSEYRPLYLPKPFRIHECHAYLSHVLSGQTHPASKAIFQNQHKIRTLISQTFLKK